MSLNAGKNHLFHPINGFLPNQVPPNTISSYWLIRKMEMSEVIEKRWGWMCSGEGEVMDLNWMQ